MMMMIHFD